jgi:hypothetical protein
MKILFINHKKTNCGVYEFGRNIALALQKSKHQFLHYECESPEELRNAVKKEKPSMIIYNYHPHIMQWLTSVTTARFKVPQIGLIHEVTQTIADKADNNLFNFHLAHDPTLLLTNPLVFKAGRLIAKFDNHFAPPKIPTIGSFGFAGKKGQKRIVELVQEEFDVAIIRINIPFSTFGDPNGEIAKSIADDCYRTLTKKNIHLKVTHDFFDEPQLLEYLAQNTVNLFLYEEMDAERGISGAVDTAISVKRPVGITRQSMFRHLWETNPSICVENNSIKQIIKNGLEPLLPFYEKWSDEMLCQDYERIIDDVILRRQIPQIIREEIPFRTKLRNAKHYLKSKLGV